MPMYSKYDIYRIVEYREGAIFKTKKVGYHWYRMGEGPELNSKVPADLIVQNKLPPGEYVYSSTLDNVLESRCPAGGLYK